MSRSESRPAELRGTLPVLRCVSPDASDEEIAAIVAAIELADRERRAAWDAADGPGTAQGRLDGWLTVSRRAARRSGMPRGPWRISGRIGRS